MNPRPCRFCQSIRVGVAYVTGKRPGCYAVACHDCHASGPHCKHVDGPAMSKALAVERWNAAWPNHEVRDCGEVV